MKAKISMGKDLNMMVKVGSANQQVGRMQSLISKNV